MKIPNLYNKVWNIHKVSPFRTDSLEEHQIASLRENLYRFLSVKYVPGCRKHVNNSFPLDGDSRLSVRISSLEEQGLDAFAVEVVFDPSPETVNKFVNFKPRYIKTITNRTSKERVTLICFRIESDSARSGLSSNFQLLLCKGTLKLTRDVFHWLENQFDTKVSNSPISIPPITLSNIARSFVEELRVDCGVLGEDIIGTDAKIKNNQVQPLELVFELPAEVTDQGLERITISVPRPALQVLHSATSELHIKERNFIEIITEYFSDYCNIELTGASLSKVVTPDFHVESQGRLKLLETTPMKNLLLEIAKACNILDVASRTLK